MNGRRQSNKETSKSCFLWFVGIQSALYLGFLWMDITGKHFGLSTSFKFLGIVLCFLWVVFHVKWKNPLRDSLIMTAALFFTVCADICLLLIDQYILGLLFFSVVQCLYLYRIHSYGGVLWRTAFWQRGGIIVISLTILYFIKIEIDFLLVLTVFYFVNICCNVRDSFEVAVGVGDFNNRWKRYSVGMVLFLLCDINVGIYNMSSYLIFGDSTYQGFFVISMVAIWFFYLPAQVLIVSSMENNI